MTKAQRQLEGAGFRVLATHRNGKWIEVVTPQGDEAVLGRQNAHCWHAFGRAAWTASGSTPVTSIDGCLGDVLDNERGYRDLVFWAPQELYRRYDALYRQSADEYQRRNQK